MFIIFDLLFLYLKTCHYLYIYNEIVKNDCSFVISENEPYSMRWFSNNQLDKWEQDTFNIFEHYKKS
jgi:hypothetical protein